MRPIRYLELINQLITLFILLGTVGVILFIRYRYLNVPFGRDEGEYAYGANILLQGKELYSNVYSLKWPGIFFIYSAVIGILGKSVWAVHTGLLIFNLSTSLVIYKILGSLISNVPAVIGSISFLVFMVQKEIQGIFANIEHFAIFFLSLGIYRLLGYWKSNNKFDLFGAGLFSGLALINKQHAVGYIVAIGIGIVIKCYFDQETRLWFRSLITYGLGVICPVLLVVLWAVTFDNFDRFWFHTVIYAHEYTGILSMKEGLFVLTKRFKETLFVNPGLWLSAYLGLLIIPRSGLDRHIMTLLYLLFIGAFIAMSFGFYYRPHYVMFMPLVLSILIGVSMNFIFEYKKWLPISIFIASVGYYFASDRNYLFIWTPDEAVDEIYNLEPFQATMTIGKYLKVNSLPTDRILIVGSEPQVNFYANKNTVTGYIYTLPLVEDQVFSGDMTSEWVKEFTTSSPEFIVIMGPWIPFVRGNNGFTKIWDTTQHYINDNNYILVGILEMSGNDVIREYWGESIEMPDDSGPLLLIYKK